VYIRVYYALFGTYAKLLMYSALTHLWFNPTCIYGSYLLQL